MRKKITQCRDESLKSCTEKKRKKFFLSNKHETGFGLVALRRPGFYNGTDVRQRRLIICYDDIKLYNKEIQYLLTVRIIHGSE